MKEISLDSRFDAVRSEVNKINNILEQRLERPVSVVLEVTDSSVILTRYLNTVVDLQIRLPIDEAQGFFTYNAVLRIQRLYVQMFSELLII